MVGPECNASGLWEYEVGFLTRRRDVLLATGWEILRLCRIVKAKLNGAKDLGQRRFPLRRRFRRAVAAARFPGAAHRATNMVRMRPGVSFVQEARPKPHVDAHPQT